MAARVFCGTLMDWMLELYKGQARATVNCATGGGRSDGYNLLCLRLEDQRRMRWLEFIAM